MLIGVDWGTSRLRAYLIDDGGKAVDTITADKGLLRVPAGGFEAVLAETIAPWRDAAPGAPILMSGMVGSRQGWEEVPYAGLPATLDDLAAGTLTVDAPSLGDDVAIVPGVAAAQASDWADVMRGEETEIFGVLAARGEASATFVLPGSHSKWVTVEKGAITGFRTYMTGELFEALSKHTILARMMDRDGGDPRAFRRGLEAASELGAPGELIQRFFNIRAETLFGRLAPEDGAGFLSGLLIGTEIATAAHGLTKVVVVGAAGLAERYADALTAFGIEAERAEASAAALGLSAIARRRVRVR